MTERSQAEPGAFGIQRALGVAAAISAITAVGIGLSVGLPLLSLTLEQRGVSEFWIGVNVAAGGVAALTVTPFTPALAFRFGTARMLLAAALLAAVTLPAFYLATAFWVWFPLRLIFSGAITAAFVLSEYWINALAPNARRGLIMGIYATVLSIGFATGPVLFAVVGVEGITPYIAGAAVLAAAAIPVVLARDTEPAGHTRSSAPIRRYLLAAPLATLAAFVFGSVESGSMSLLPVFGVQSGFSGVDSALLVSAVVAGNVLLQIPLGLAADRYDRRHLLLACALIGAGGALMMPLAATDYFWLCALLFVWGGVVAGLYTVGLTQLGSRYEGGDLAGANAAFVLMYSLGMLAGPAAMGTGLSIGGPDGLPLVVAALFALYAAVAVWRIASRRKD